MTLPEGWEYKKWELVLEIRSGRSQKQVVNPNGKYPIYGSGGIMSYADNYICDEGTTIIGRKGTINNPIYVETKFWNVDTAFGLCAFECLDKKFLYYFCKSYDFSKRNKGTTLPSLVKNDLVNILIPIPPLEVQKRIVEILDKAFEGIEKAIANSKQNLINARELFDSYLNNIFTNKGDDKKENWNIATIEKIVKLIDYRGKTPKKVDNGLRLITAKNVKKGFIQKEPMEFVEPEIYETWMTRGIPKKGDVLFTTEAPLGNIAQLDTDERVVFAQRVIIMQTNANQLNSTFLKYLLLSNFLQKQILNNATGATAQGIKSKLLKKIKLVYPTIEEQKNIVNNLDNLSTETQRLEGIYKRKLELLEELKQSILERAFRGELTANK